MNYNEIRRSVGRDLFEIFILPVDPKRLGLDAGVAGDRRRKRDFARWFVWPGQLFGWNVAGRYCTGLKIPWRHPNRHERECGPPLPSPHLISRIVLPAAKVFALWNALVPEPDDIPRHLLHNACCFYISNFVFFLGFSPLLLFFFGI